jgi:hypothetical protein
MNERIRELAEQAKAESSEWLGSKPATTITYDELEKFALLIVQECIDCTKATSYDTRMEEYTRESREYSRGYVHGCIDAIVEMRGRFGIEEFSELKNDV